MERRKRHRPLGHYRNALDISKVPDDQLIYRATTLRADDVAGLHLNVLADDKHLVRVASAQALMLDVVRCDQHTSPNMTVTRWRRLPSGRIMRQRGYDAQDTGGDSTAWDIAGGRLAGVSDSTDYYTVEVPDVDCRTHTPCGDGLRDEMDLRLACDLVEPGSKLARYVHLADCILTLMADSGLIELVAE